MIVLTKEQKDLFLETKKEFQQELLANGVDFVPVEAKGDLWILPNEVLADDRFSKLKLELFDNGKLGSVSIREVDKTELIEPVEK